MDSKTNKYVSYASFVKIWLQMINIRLMYLYGIKNVSLSLLCTYVDKHFSFRIRHLIMEAQNSFLYDQNKCPDRNNLTQYTVP